MTTTYKKITRDNQDKTFTSADLTLMVEGNNNTITVDTIEGDIYINGNYNTILTSSNSATLYINIDSGVGNRIVLFNSGYVSVYTQDTADHTTIQVYNLDNCTLRVNAESACTVNECDLDNLSLVNSCTFSNDIQVF